MSKNRTIKILVVVVLGFIVVLLFAFNITLDNQKSPHLVNKPCIPTFADGDGPYYKPDTAFREKLVPDKNNGEKLLVKGRVYRSDCVTSISNVVLDIWQANEKGKYEDEWYRGRINTDKNGKYEFETVMPKGYGEGTAFRPPHIHFKVWENNTLIITSEMFFPDVKGKSGFNDAYIVSLEKKNIWGNRVNYAYHDIILP